MDCTFTTDQGTFNYRVGAIILDENRLPQGELYPEFFRTELLDPSKEIKHIITREY